MPEINVLFSESKEHSEKIYFCNDIRFARIVFQNKVASKKIATRFF